MTDDSVIIKFLSKLGYHPKTKYYSNIENWREWYENKVDKFHKYRDQSGEEREIYKLGMAKKTCEDWASILFTERDSLICKNKKNQTYLDKKLKDLKFNDEILNNIEDAFWSGTVGTITRINNAVINDGVLDKDETTDYELINLTANQVIPLRILHKRVVDVAFISEESNDKEKLYYIEIHILKDNGYTIYNYYIDEKGKAVEKEGIVANYSTKSNIPLFNLFGPRIVNNIPSKNGLGMSVYANAIDELKSCDISFNNFNKDIELGGKKVFYNKKLITYLTKTYTDKLTGEVVTKEIPIYPDDITKQQFQIVGDDMATMGDVPLMKEYNPTLRIDENEKAINLSLNLLSFKVGLGKGYYKFENQTIVTATQYLGENKDLVGNAKKHRNALNEYTVGIAKSILLLGRILFGEEVNEDDEIELTDKDTFLVSDEELNEQYRQDFNMGVMSKTTYLMKARGMSEVQAKEELERIKNDNPSVESLIGG